MTTTLMTTYPDHPWVFVDPDGKRWPHYDCYIEWCRTIKPGQARVGKEDFMSVWLSKQRTAGQATGTPLAAAATTIAAPPATGAVPPSPAPRAPTAGLGSVLAERKKQHGDFTDHARCSVALKAVFDTEVRNRINRGQDDLTPTQLEACHMILHKMARIVSGDANHLDHWRDIAGYATITADRIPV